MIVDEIQRLPGLLNEVHRFIEERGLRFALLGSSARKLRAAKTAHGEGGPLYPEERERCWRAVTRTARASGSPCRKQDAACSVRRAEYLARRDAINAPS